MRVVSPAARQPSPLPSPSGRGSRAFTLIELMVSIGLIVFLMVGINQVFKLSSDAMNAGQAVSENIRSERAIAASLQEDAHNWVSDPPIFYIVNEYAKVYKLDANGAVQYDATGSPIVFTDASGNPILKTDSTGKPIRHDYMGFFTRGSYHRQTGTAPNLNSPITSSEAFVWFGHVDDVPGGSRLATKRNTVGRVAMLLKDESQILNLAPLDRYIRWAPLVPPPLPNLSPLRAGSLSTDNVRVQRSRYDLAGVTTEQFRGDVLFVRAGVQSASVPFDGSMSKINPALSSTWWQLWPDPQGTVVSAPIAYRFQADPAYGSSASDRAAYASPIFLENVTQLIIEYAGDFVTQDASGAITANVPDGQIDSVIADIQDPRFPNDPTQRIQFPQTCWYGLYRNADANVMPTYNSATKPLLTWTSPPSSVMPLYMVGYKRGWTYGGLPHAGAPFEREPDPASDFGPANFTRYGNVTRYTCIWANPVAGRAQGLAQLPADIVNNGMPAKVRILMKVEDPAGRYPNAWYEYILGPR